MKLEQQVCSLEMAKRLKKLEVGQESLYEYYLWPVQDDGEAPVTLNASTRTNRLAANDHCAAFTVAELGEMFPKSRIIFSFSGFAHGSWACEVNTGGENEHREYADTEADARAKMLILLENKLVTV